MATAAFVSCGGTGAPQGRRREVVVNGRPVKTVDVHAHCAVPAAMALMGRKLETEALLMTDTRARLRAMDEQGIDVEALSINPFWYGADRDVAAGVEGLELSDADKVAILGGTAMGLVRIEAQRSEVITGKFWSPEAARHDHRVLEARFPLSSQGTVFA